MINKNGQPWQYAVGGYSLRVDLIIMLYFLFNSSIIFDITYDILM